MNGKPKVNYHKCLGKFHNTKSLILNFDLNGYKWNENMVSKNFQGSSSKNNVEFPWALHFGLGISNGCNTILPNFQGWSFVSSGIFKGKITNLEIPGVLFWSEFFWNSSKDFRSSVYWNKYWEALKPKTGPTLVQNAKTVHLPRFMVTIFFFLGHPTNFPPTRKIQTFLEKIIFWWLPLILYIGKFYETEICKQVSWASLAKCYK